MGTRTTILLFLVAALAAPGVVCAQDASGEARGASEAESTGEGETASDGGDAEGAGGGETASEGGDAESTGGGETASEGGDAESTGEAEAESEEPLDYGTGTGGGPDLSFDLPVFGHTTFSMTSTSTVRYRGNNYDTNRYDDDFWSVQQRFDLALQGDELRLEVRLDAFLPFAASETVRTTSASGMPMVLERPGWFGSQAAGALGAPAANMGNTCSPADASLCYVAWDVRPERLVLRWEHESWLIELGDAQIVFGRGVALSFRKVDLLGVDNALRGGHVRFDDGHFRARIHAGVANPQNQDPITLRINPDPDDIFAAASVGATFGPQDMFSVSGHAVRVWFADTVGGLTSSRSGQAVDVAGWTFEAPALADGQLALYAEANGMRRTFSLGGVEHTETGRAVYASAQLLVENLTILVEWKDYSNFLLAAQGNEPNPWRIYNAAPSLEFDGPQRLRAIGNQRGGSIRIDYGFLPGPWSILVGTTLYGLDDDDFQVRDPWGGILVSHSWAGFTRRQEYDGDVTWSITANGGYRLEQCIRENCSGIGGERPGELDREIIHGQVEITVASGDHGFDLTADHRYEGERVFGGALARFQIGGWALTYTYGVNFAISLGLRWTDQFANVVSARNQRDYNVIGDRGVLNLGAAGSMYPSIEVRYNFDPSNSVRLFFGQTPGGLICSGGVCRQVPPFEGGLLQFVLRL
jgi:hypothetical protein